jgi:hypothetical protein
MAFTRSSTERLLDHRQRLLRRAPRFEEARQVVALAQLRDLERDPPRPGIPVPLPVSVALDLAQGRPCALRGPVLSSTSSCLIRSAAKARISRTRSPAACFSISSINISIWFKVSQPEPSKIDDGCPASPPAARCATTGAPRAASYTYCRDTAPSQRRTGRHGHGSVGFKRVVSGEFGVLQRQLKDFL